MSSSAHKTVPYREYSACSVFFRLKGSVRRCVEGSEHDVDTVWPTR
jgi:hypothetical protein